MSITMILKGKVHKYGDNVNTDEIIPARYLNTTDPSELARHCMEDIDGEFVSRVSPGDIIVAGKNFGCGSSREHAPICIKSARISCVIAASFARIFYRNAINTGLPIFESSAASAEINADDIVEADLDQGRILDVTTGKTYASEPFPAFMRELINVGGLMAYVTGKYLRRKRGS
jgi:3-isopropylmalate/(R)-2-methylmalate dehydratase small subunit